MLVHYVAERKKLLYDSARDDLATTIKSCIPVVLKHKLKDNKSDLLTVGMMYGGQVTEAVATHQSLTHTMSMRRLNGERPLSAGSRGFMDVSAHYINHDHPLQQHLPPQMGRLEALRMNAVYQLVKAFVAREQKERRDIELDYWTSRTLISEFYECESRAAITLNEDKDRNRIASAEVGHYLLSRKKEQVGARNSVLETAVRSLKAERDKLREFVLVSSRKEADDVTAQQPIQRSAVEAMIAELPQSPSNSNVDSEVARLLLKERRKKRTEYFTEYL